MRRRTLLAGAAGGLVVVIGAGVGVVTQMPVTPEAPTPEMTEGLGWIAYRDGRFTLTLPRVEMGQNIATALKQVACVELGADWDAVTVSLHSTHDMAPVRSTVGSESVMRFMEPLAQACASLRDAIAAGRASGDVALAPRPRAQLRAFQKDAFDPAPSEIAQGRAIVTGQPLYAADVRRPDMLHGRVLRALAPLERATRPRMWNLDAARAVPGFIAVVEACGPAIGGAAGLGIVASRPGAIDDVAAALQVVWEGGDAPQEQEADVDPFTAIDIDARLARGALPHVVVDGDPVDGDWDVDLRIDVPLAAHGAIEPRAAVAEWRDGALTVWSGTQDAFFVRAVLADQFGLAAEGIVVQTCRVGGAFGGKMFCSVEAEAAALAKAVGAPVKVQWTRPQEFAQGFHRPPSSQRIRARVKEGRITDWDHARVSSHVILTAAILPRWLQQGADFFVGDEGAASGMTPPYDLGAARASYDLTRLPVHTGPWRGLGAGPNGLAVESAMDDLAARAGVDPLVFRLNHVQDPRLAAVLTRLGEISEWGGPATAAPDRRTGRGLACGVYNGKSYAAVAADVAVASSGAVAVTRLWCVHDCGLVVNRDQVRAQCEGNLAFSIGLILTDALPVAQGRVVAESFFDAPIPRASDTPLIVVDLVESDNPPTGAGETAMAAGPGAIANAIRSATGRRPTRFPVTPSALTV